MAIKSFVDGNSTAQAYTNDMIFVGAATGTQTIQINAGVTGVSVDANIERFVLTGNLSTYRFAATATGTSVQDATGVTIATIPSLNQTATVVFADGSAPLVQTGGSTFTLGGAPLASTATAVTAASMGAGFTATNTVALSGATTVNEGASVTYTVTLGSNATGSAVTVPYTLTGTTTAGVDFTGAASGTLSIPVGSSSATLTLPATADSLTEGAETIVVTLGTPSGGYTVVSGQGTVTTTVADTSLTVVGGNIPMTTGVDFITGSAGNDTITADNSTANKQLTVADQIDGGAGNDTLRVFLKTDDATTGVPSTITGIETFYVNGGIVTALTAPTGTLTLSIDSPIVDTEATYTVSGQAVILANHTVTDNKTTTITSSTDTVANVTLNKQTALSGKVNTLDLKGTLVATANLTATGTASAITLTNTGLALTTVNFAGDKALKLTEALSGLTTINASAATGALTVNMSALGADKLMKFTGGAGDDRLIFAATHMLATDTINGGAGTDTVQINDTTPVYAALNGYTNIEKLALGTTAATVDVGQLTSIRSFEVTSGNLTETFNNSTNASTYKIVNDAGNTGTVTISNGVGQSTTTVNIDNQSADSKTLAKLVVAGETIINLSSTGKAGSTNNLTELDNADNSAITLTGNIPFNLNTALDATNTGSSFDASGFTAALSVAGSSKNDVIKGGSGNDFIYGSVSIASQADILTGGSGSDNFVFVSTTDKDAIYKQSVGTSAITKITDFVAGTDKIALIHVGTLFTSATLANTQTIATAADLTAVYGGITPIAASTATNASGVVITVSAGAAAGTYLYINDATATVSTADDMLINITGISGTLTTSDIIFA